MLHEEPWMDLEIESSKTSNSLQQLHRLQIDTAFSVSKAHISASQDSAISFTKRTASARLGWVLADVQPSTHLSQSQSHSVVSSWSPSKARHIKSPNKLCAFCTLVVPVPCPLQSLGVSVGSFSAHVNIWTFFRLFPDLIVNLDSVA